MRKLIYLTVALNVHYITLLELLLASLKLNGNVSSDTDILIITDQAFKEVMTERFKLLDLLLHYHVIQVNNMFEACRARLGIFDYPEISKYDKILYLDTDILIGGDLAQVLDLPIDPDVIYAMAEGKIDNKFWGSEFFKATAFNLDTIAFSSGVMFFTNSPGIKDLFDEITTHINEDLANSIKPVFYDQPYIVYHAIITNRYNNNLLNDHIKANPGEICTIAHFCGGPGSAVDKHKKMVSYWKRFSLVKIIIPDDVSDKIVAKLMTQPYQCQKLGPVIFDHDSVKIGSYQYRFELMTTHKINIILGRNIYIMCFNSCYDNWFMFKDFSVYYGVINQTS